MSRLAVSCVLIAALAVLSAAHQQADVRNAITANAGGRSKDTKTMEVNPAGSTGEAHDPEGDDPNPNDPLDTPEELQKDLSTKEDEEHNKDHPEVYVDQNAPEEEVGELDTNGDGIVMKLEAENHGLEVDDDDDDPYYMENEDHSLMEAAAHRDDKDDEDSEYVPEHIVTDENGEEIDVDTQEDFEEEETVDANVEDPPALTEVAAHGDEAQDEQEYEMEDHDLMEAGAHGDDNDEEDTEDDPEGFIITDEHGNDKYISMLEAEEMHKMFDGGKEDPDDTTNTGPHGDDNDEEDSEDAPRM